MYGWNFCDDLKLALSVPDMKGLELAKKYLLRSHIFMVMKIQNIKSQL
jgi:hypothetical protein